MWRRTTIACIMARTPVYLRDARHSGVRNKPCSSSSSSNSNNTDSGDSSKINEHESAAAAASLTASSLPSSSSMKTTEGTAPRASVPSPLASLMSTVEQLKEATRRTQHTLHQQEDALQLLQQKLALMERQVGQLESTAEGLRGKLNEVHSVVGEIVMGQRNTDLLLQQIERQQMQANATTSGPAGKKKEGEGVRKVKGKHDDAAVPVSGVSGSMTSQPGGEASAEPSTPATSCAADSSLKQKVAMLEARVDQLTLELFSADWLVSAGKLATSPASPSAAEKLAIVLASPNKSAQRIALIQALQRRHAVRLFTDAAGVTRVTSQCVVVHNIPLNMGATELREICVHHVCDDDSSGLVSCMVWRTPGTEAQASTAKAAESSTSSSAGASPVFPSKQQQQQQQQHTSRQQTTVEDVSQTKVSNAGAGALPRSDAVAAIRPHTKSFEVVFATTALAVRALTVLNGLLLKPTYYAAPLPLAVEPVVSAEVLAALRELQTADEATAGQK